MALKRAAVRSIQDHSPPVEGLKRSRPAYRSVLVRSNFPSWPKVGSGGLPGVKEIAPSTHRGSITHPDTCREVAFSHGYSANVRVYS
jgi:hypothetical protein